VDVHRIFDILRVPEGKFNRLKASFNYYYYYTKHTSTSLLYCVSRLSEVVSLYYRPTIVWFDLFEVKNKKCNFLESMVLVLL